MFSARSGVGEEKYLEMGRSPCCSKEAGLNRGAWTATEDRILTEYIKAHGEGKWRDVPKKAGLKRCGKSCRLRWLNYLRPDIKRGNITQDEEELIIRLHKLLGNRWSLIAGRLPGRTDNEIKNYWNTNIGKKMSSKPRIQSAETPDSRAINRRPSSDNAPPVFHAKPSRCTKVFIHTEPPKTDTVQESAMGHDQKANPPESSAATGYGEGDNSSDFMMDFEIDPNFLSEFLNSDFSQLCDFDNGVEEDNAMETAPVLLKNEEALETPNPSSIDSFLDSEMDWFC